MLKPVFCFPVKFYLAFNMAVTGQLMSLSYSPYASALGAMDAVQLDYMKVPPQFECNLQFFGSNKHLKGTVFYLPRFKLGTDENGNYLFDPLRTVDPNKWLLSVGIYFPRNEEVLKSSTSASRETDTGGCNIDQVEHYLAKTNPELALVVDGRPTVVAEPMPFGSVELIIPGVRARGRFADVRDISSTQDAKPADPDTQVVFTDYVGKSYTLDIPISAGEKEILDDRVSTQKVIKPVLIFYFNARQRDGSLSAAVDYTQIGTQLATAGGTKQLVEAEFKLAMRTAIENSQFSIDLEASETANFDKVRDSLLETLLNEFKTPPPVPAEKQTECEAKPGLYCVSIIADLLIKRGVRRFELNNTSTSLEVAVRTVADIQPRTSDPRMRSVRLRSLYSSETLGDYIHAGDRFCIAPTLWYQENINYVPRHSYITSSDIATLNLYNYPQLLLENFYLDDVDENPIPGLPGFHLRLRGRDRFNSVWYRWRRTNYVAVRKKVNACEVIQCGNRKMGSNVYPENLKEIQALPIYVSFSAQVGRRLMRLGDLEADTSHRDLFTAEYKEGNNCMEITANKDLGNLILRERFREEIPESVGEKNQILDSITMESNDYFDLGAYYLYGEAVVVRNDTEALTKQRTIWITVSKPEKPGEEQAPEVLGSPQVVPVKKPVPEVLPQP